MKHLFIIYGLDVLIVLLSIGAAASANVERTREPFPRFQLLMPGLVVACETAVAHKPAVDRGRKQQIAPIWRDPRPSPDELPDAPG